MGIFYQNKGGLRWPCRRRGDPCWIGRAGFWLKKEGQHLRKTHTPEGQAFRDILAWVWSRLQGMLRGPIPHRPCLKEQQLPSTLRGAGVWRETLSMTQGDGGCWELRVGQENRSAGILISLLMRTGSHSIRAHPYDLIWLKNLFQGPVSKYTNTLSYCESGLQHMNFGETEIST